MIKKKETSNGYIKSVLVAYFILFLHVLLIAVLVCLVIFFRGIIHYMAAIFLIASLAIFASGYFFYRRIKKEGKSLKEVLMSPMFCGRTVEVSLFGGFASLKLGSPRGVLPLENDTSKRIHQLEDPAKIRIDELAELVRLLEKGLITLEEYNIAKSRVFKP